MHNYWVVGAMWGGQNDQYEIFMRRGYWFLGYGDEESPQQEDRRNQMRAGDRIAIKRMLGRGSSEIEIRALGIIKEIDSEDSCVYIDWLVKNMSRHVPARGCFGSVHGPFNQEDEWVQQAFVI